MPSASGNSASIDAATSLEIRHHGQDVQTGTETQNVHIVPSGPLSQHTVESLRQFLGKVDPRWYGFNIECEYRGYWPEPTALNDDQFRAAAACFQAMTEIIATTPCCPSAVTLQCNIRAVRS